LIQAYQGLSVEEGKNLLADLDIPGDTVERLGRVGPKSSLEVYNVFTQGGSTNSFPPAYSSIGVPIDASVRTKLSAQSKTRLPSARMTDRSVADLGGSGQACIERSLEIKSFVPIMGHQQEQALASVTIPNLLGSPAINVERKLIRLRNSKLAVIANDLMSSSTVAHSPAPDLSFTSGDDCVDMVGGDDDAVAVARAYPQSSRISAVESSQSSAEDETLMVRLKKRRQQSSIGDARSVQAAKLLSNHMARSDSCPDVIELE
jgi:hypothetical protein